MIGFALLAGLMNGFLLSVASPTGQPSSLPSYSPSGQPSSLPSDSPTGQPSSLPSTQPTAMPSTPTGQPSSLPSGVPTHHPSRQPTGQPSGMPTSHPSFMPTTEVRAHVTFAVAHTLVDLSLGEFYLYIDTAYRRTVCWELRPLPDCSRIIITRVSDALRSQPSTEQSQKVRNLLTSIVRIDFTVTFDENFQGPLSPDSVLSSASSSSSAAGLEKVNQLSESVSSGSFKNTFVSIMIPSVNSSFAAAQLASRIIFVSPSISTPAYSTFFPRVTEEPTPVPTLAPTIGMGLRLNADQFKAFFVIVGIVVGLGTSCILFTQRRQQYKKKHAKVGVQDGTAVAATMGVPDRSPGREPALLAVIINGDENDGNAEDDEVVFTKALLQREPEPVADSTALLSAAEEFGRFLVGPSPSPSPWLSARLPVASVAPAPRIPLRLLLEQLDITNESAGDWSSGEDIPGPVQRSAQISGQALGATNRRTPARRVVHDLSSSSDSD